MEYVLELRAMAPHLDQVDLVRWNPETGELSGALAPMMYAQAAEARERGYIEFQVMYYSEQDPLTTREGMAMLCLSMLYRVPEALVDALPPASDNGGRDY